MADITKKVDRGIPSTKRYQLFTQADASTGDVILVEDSLGQPAQKVSIEAIADMTVRFNVYQTVYPKRIFNEGFVQTYPGLDNISRGTLIQSDSNAVISISADETLVLSNELVISDIEIVSAAGDFNILVT